MAGTYDFLLDTYETEILKITGIWNVFGEEQLDWRPAGKSRTVREQFEHQLQSEHKWMTTMLDIQTGDALPAGRGKKDYIEKYRQDATRRLEIMRSKPDDWWRGVTAFFDVQRSRAWIVCRRINHSTHHRGQLVVYLRVLEARVPSVYGPTADTGGVVKYSL